MSGLEVVGLVASIISAYTGAAQLYQSRRKEKRERKKKREMEELQLVVSTSGPQVKQVYDEDFRRLRQRFARGDGQLPCDSAMSRLYRCHHAAASQEMCRRCGIDIGRNALMEQLILAQQTLIGLLSGSANHNLAAIVHPHHDKLYESASAVCRSSINALTEQYQRLLQVASLSMMGVSPLQTSRVQPLTRAQTHALPYCPGKPVWTDSRRTWSCKPCGWVFGPPDGCMQIFDQYGHFMSGQCSLENFTSELINITVGDASSAKKMFTKTSIEIGDSKSTSSCRTQSTNCVTAAAAMRIDKLHKEYEKHGRFS